MSADTGGAADPHEGNYHDASGAACGKYVKQPGMTLLDYFAGQALAGWLSSIDQVNAPEEGDSSDTEHKDAVARWCYGYAAAMLTERARRTEGK